MELLKQLKFRGDGGGVLRKEKQVEPALQIYANDEILYTDLSHFALTL
jgi:hypothetical protein